MANKYAFQCYLIQDKLDGEASLRIGDLFSSKWYAEMVAKQTNEWKNGRFNRVDVVRTKVSYAKWASLFVTEAKCQTGL